MFPIRKILHPTDFSEQSRPAFELACSLARDYGAELILCNIYMAPIVPVGEGMIVEIPAEEADQMAAELEAMKPTDPSIPVSRRFLRGNAAEEIIRLADENKIDMIVMGTHGRSGLGRLLMGSVAEAVMRKAPCPVVTVKVPVSSAKRETPAGKLVTA